MMIESFLEVEAVRGVLGKFIQQYFDLSGFDIITTSQTDVSLGAVGTSTAPSESPEASYEVAATDLAELRTPPEAPNQESFSNPRGYLEYLKFYLERRIEVLEGMDTGPSIEVISLDGGLVSREGENIADAWIKEYRAVLSDVNSELNRIGGPRASQLPSFIVRRSRFRLLSVEPSLTSPRLVLYNIKKFLFCRCILLQGCIRTRQHEKPLNQKMFYTHERVFV